MKFYKIINGQLVSGSGSKPPDDTWETDWSKIDAKEDGSFYTYYLEVGGKYVVDTVKEDEKAKAEYNAQVKLDKVEQLANLTVTTNSNTFDADDVARADMLSAKDSIATTEELLKSMTPEDADAYIEANQLRLMLTITEDYTITHTQWKMAGNNWYECPVQELSEALALAMQAKGQILAS